MATTQLNRPTGTEVVNALGVVAGVENTIGDFTATDIDNDYANNGTSSILDIEYQKMLTAIAGAGYDWTALDTVTEYPYIWRALLQSTYLAYYCEAKLSGNCGEDCDENCYAEKVEKLKRLICQNMTVVGVSSEYCINSLDLFNSSYINNCDHEQAN